MQRTQLAFSIALTLTLTTLSLLATEPASATEPPTSRITGSIELDSVAEGETQGLPSTLTVLALDPTTLDYLPHREIPLTTAGRFDFEHPIPEPDCLRLEAAGLRAYLNLDQGGEEIRVTLRARDAGGSVVEGSAGNDLAEAFFALLDAKNREYFDELKEQGHRLLADTERDPQEVERLEAVRDRHLELFVGDLGEALEAMGPSAAVYAVLRTFDVYKQRRFFVDSRDRFAAWNPQAKMTRILARLLEDSRRADVGAPAPTFRLADAEGTEVSLDQYRGRWVLVDFWASWCLNCRFEMPRMVEVYRDWHDHGFEIVGITARDSRQAWLETIASESLPWPNLWDDDSAVSDRYLVSGQLPANYLVDPEGQIVARNLLAVDLRSELESLIPRSGP